MTEFTENVLKIIKSIPPGKVMTYGQIAAKAGNPWGARQVSRLLHTMSEKYDLPWHRVINSKGGISLTGIYRFKQIDLLIGEGIIFDKDTINLSKYLYKGN